jgi:hypothetical protein
MLEVTGGGEFGQRSLQTCGGSATNSVDLAMFRKEKEKGVEGGVPGVFKEGRDMGRGLGFGAREEING